MNGTGIVVVGVDGSAGALAALEQAMDEAVRRHAHLRVVAAVPPPEYWVASYGGYLPPPLDDVLTEARSAAQKDVEGVRARRPDLAGLAITVEARTGAAGDVLVDAAAGADVLVVGHRGRGALRSAVLGSVGLYCVLHALCPVLIVRPTAVPSGAGGTAAGVATA